MYYVYIIKSLKNGRLYKGYAENLKKRILEHNKGRIKSTKSGLPWKLIYYEGFISKTDALKEELFIKSGKGKERLKYLLKATMEGWLSGRKRWS